MFTTEYTERRYLNGFGTEVSVDPKKDNSDLDKREKNFPLAVDFQYGFVPRIYKTKFNALTGKWEREEIMERATTAVISEYNSEGRRVLAVETAICSRLDNFSRMRGRVEAIKKALLKLTDKRMRLHLFYKFVFVSSKSKSYTPEIQEILKEFGEYLKKDAEPKKPVEPQSVK